MPSVVTGLFLVRPQVRLCLLDFQTPNVYIHYKSCAQKAHLVEPVPHIQGLWPCLCPGFKATLLLFAACHPHSLSPHFISFFSVLSQLSHETA